MSGHAVMFTSTISISKWTVLCVLTFAVLTCLNFTWAKLCCDQDCISKVPLMSLHGTMQ